MTGESMTGNISSPSLTFSNNHWELISNSHPSSIDFDNLASDNRVNSGVVNNKYDIWNPAVNSWINHSGDNTVYDFSKNMEEIEDSAEFSFFLNSHLIWGWLFFSSYQSY